MKHHYTVERELAIPRFVTVRGPGGAKTWERRGDRVGTRFVVELDVEQLVAKLGARALRAPRGTVRLHDGALKVIALGSACRVKDPATPELELAG